MAERRQVVIEVTSEVVVDVPADWDKEMIDFFFGESSHCMATEIGTLFWKEAFARPGCCNTCGNTQGEYLREATVQDLEDESPLDEKLIAELEETISQRVSEDLRQKLWDEKDKTASWNQQTKQGE